MASNPSNTTPPPSTAINPPIPTPPSPTPQITWTTSMDRKLLLVAFGRHIARDEYAFIARLFVDADPQPTAKQVQERLMKLRRQQQVELAKLGMREPETQILPVIGEGMGGVETKVEGEGEGAMEGVVMGAAVVGGKGEGGEGMGKGKEYRSGGTQT